MRQAADKIGNAKSNGKASHSETGEEKSSEEERKDEERIQALPSDWSRGGEMERTE